MNSGQLLRAFLHAGVWPLGRNARRKFHVDVLNAVPNEPVKHGFVPFRDGLYATLVPANRLTVYMFGRGVPEGHRQQDVLCNGCLAHAKLFTDADDIVTGHAQNLPHYLVLFKPETWAKLVQ